MRFHQLALLLMLLNSNIVVKACTETCSVNLLESCELFESFSYLDEPTRDYPKDYFQSPVNYKIRLSGTFGELRPNHFHAGIDIKSPDGKTGAKLFAVADGTISRIKVQAAGYGNVLYLKHPNGYTSVYAHLDHFPESIAAYVKEKQYEKKSFEVNLFPPAGKFEFAQGEVIGWLGLSGRSYGPHLHFEIRDTHTEKPINPQLFGIGAVDNVDPKLHQIRVYRLNDRLETLGAKNIDLIKSGNNYHVKGDTLNIAAWRTGLAIKAYDHVEGVKNWNGIYSLEMKQDGKKVYGFSLESFAFSESRYINAHLDYRQQQKNKNYFHRCYQLAGNRLSFYDENVDNGIITLYRNKASKIEITVKDAAGNSSILTFWVKRKTVPEVSTAPYNYHFKALTENQASGDGWKIDMKKGSLYEDLYWSAKSSPKLPNTYSKLYTFSNEYFPVHRYFNIELKGEDIPEGLKSKAFIAHKNSKGKYSTCGGKWDGEFLKARARKLGDFCIVLDQKAPTLTAVSYKRDLRGAKKMSFKATDDVDTEKNINAFSYEATVDGQWILLEYDAKNNLLTHRFDDRIAKGEHELEITLTDSVGNETKWNRKFLR